MDKKFGSHVSFKAPNYLVGASNDSIEYGANAMMIYLGAPQSARRVPKERFKLDEYQNLPHKIEKENIIVHAPYIVNPASLEKADFAIEFLIKEIETMNYLGLTKLVLHPGAHTKFTREEGIEKLVYSLKKIFAATKNVEILLETMAGKGTELGTSFKELNIILNKANNSRLGICLDTCHVWEAGYDINQFEKFISELHELNVYDKIKVLHINDSKNPINAHKDRHENIGKGNIGFDTLKKFVNEEFDGIVKILETPWVEGKPIYKQEIEMFSV